METLFDTEKLSWEKHPSAKDVSIKRIITTQRFGKDSPSVLMIKVPAGVGVPEHVHEESEDILFIVAGQATMWIDGTGDVQLQQDRVIRVPRNTRHRIFDVSDELLIYDVFSPGIM